MKGKRTGLDRRYTFTTVGDALALDLNFDFQAFLEQLVSTDRFEHLRMLPIGWFHMPLERKLGIYPLTQGAQGVAAAYEPSPNVFGNGTQQVGAEAKSTAA